jgi:hypothetical protein
MDTIEEQSFPNMEGMEGMEGMPGMEGMQAMLGNLFKNMKMDENMFETCAGFLCQSSLEVEQYEMIMEICQDKLEELTIKKNIEKVTQIIQSFKQQLDASSPLHQFLDNIYNIKAYMNAENEITEKKPTIEYVIEMNYNKENFTFFYTTVLDNINDKIYGETCIMIQPEEEEEEKEKEMETEKDGEKEETEEMKEDSESESENEMETDENVTKFEDDTKYEKLMEKMSWCGENVKTELQTVLNQIFTVFESDETIEW